MAAMSRLRSECSTGSTRTATFSNMTLHEQVFSPLRYLPQPKKAVPGLVSTKVPEIETADALRRRIDEATKFIDLERLCLSPQCGFASVPARAGRGFPMDLTERKLARVVEVAEQVWN
jgi:5-methyltetrahydropteroyltriglutamate--homocysteine methyltransferase